MKITLTQNYISKEAQLQETERQIAVLEEKLKSPGWTVDDVIKHIGLLKDKKRLIS